MRSIKEKILAAALALFNEKGVEIVSMRDIASKLEISVGNLTYHFPSKNDLVHSLCIQCIGEVDKSATEVLRLNIENLFVGAYRQIEAILKTQLKYKFIFNKRYAEIITSLPAVQEHYRKVLKIRFEEWHAFHGILVKEKLAESTLVDDSNAVGYILNMLALFWHQEAAIYTPDLPDHQKLAHALSLLFHVYKPYLTKKGLNQLMPLLKVPKSYR